MLDRVVRATGGDPARVRILADGLRRAAAGRLELEQERRGGLGFAPELLPVLVGAMLVVMSLSLALAVGLAKPASVQVFVLAAAQGVTVLVVAATLAGPLLLSDDDARVIGAWPVTSRDVALARLGLVLRPVVLASLAISAAPLLVYAVRGPFPVIPAMLLAGGLALQAVAITLALATALVGLCGWLGRRRAQHVVMAAVLVASLAGSVVPLLVSLVMGEPERGGELPAPPSFLPPAWFGAWGRLGEPGALPLALLAAALALFAIPMAFRVLTRGGRAEEEAREDARPRPAPLLEAIRALLVPFTPGREGHALRTLFVAHLREDWRYAVLRGLPLAWLAAFVAVAMASPERLAFVPRPGELLPVRGALLFLLAATYAPLLVVPMLPCSRDHRAAWFLAQADLAPARLLAAERGIGRALLGMPLTGLLVLAEIRAGASPSLVVTDALLVALAFETSFAILLRYHLVLPFSRSWLGPPADAVLVLGVMGVPVSAMAGIWLTLVHDRSWAGKALTLGALAAGLVAARVRAGRLVERRGLRLELAADE